MPFRPRVSKKESLVPRTLFARAIMRWLCQPATPVLHVQIAALSGTDMSLLSTSQTRIFRIVFGFFGGASLPEKLDFVSWLKAMKPS
jgi:hypothetical protein